MTKHAAMSAKVSSSTPASRRSPAAKPGAKRSKAPGSASVTIVPHLVCAGAAKAIDFYKKAFGATEQMRLPGPGGKLMHAAVKIDGVMVMLVDESPEMGAVSPTSLQGTPVTLHMIVPDADATIARAAKAGAKVLMPAADQFWGDRYGVILDPFGHRWAIATPQRNLSLDEIKAAARKFMSG